MSIKTDIYTSMEDLDYFVKSCIVQSDLFEKNFHSLSSFLKENVLGLLEEYARSNDNRTPSLPDYLQRFTAGEKLVECLSFAIDDLIKKKKYNQAILYLRFLIRNDRFCLTQLGRWFTKLINILVEFNKPDKALVS